MKNEHAQELGKLGGEASVKKRFDGLSKEEISEKMRRVRLYNKKRAEVQNLLINDTNKYC